MISILAKKWGAWAYVLKFQTSKSTAWGDFARFQDIPCAITIIRFTFLSKSLPWKYSSYSNMAIFELCLRKYLIIVWKKKRFSCYNLQKTCVAGKKWNSVFEFLKNYKLVWCTIDFQNLISSFIILVLSSFFSDR